MTVFRPACQGPSHVSRFRPVWPILWPSRGALGALSGPCGPLASPSSSWLPHATELLCVICCALSLSSASSNDSDNNDNDDSTTVKKKKKKKKKKEKTFPGSQSESSSSGNRVRGRKGPPLEECSLCRRCTSSWRDSKRGCTRVQCGGRAGACAREGCLRHRVGGRGNS